MSLEGIQLGNYRLQQQIGSGGMGEVYLAEDTRIPRQVAIKVIHSEVAPYPDPQTIQEAERLFQREMKAIARLDHPHILPLYDFGEGSFNRKTYTFMVMPFRAEGSLADWLQQRNNPEPLAPQDVAHFIEQAASALQHAHNHQLIHQDVKPSNFLIRHIVERPTLPDLLLADFGIAKFNTSTSAKSQNIRGTPAYMAPEQWDSQSVPASDQYALAVMAYQLLTGRPPFVGRMGQVMRQHFTAQAQPPSSFNQRIPTALDEVILHALEKKPEDRFPSILQFSQSLRLAVEHRGTLRATLAISEDEAIAGTRRLLFLPGGRQVTVTVPPRAYNGQTLRLEGKGEPYYQGGSCGPLLLTLSVTAGTQVKPGHDPELNEKTVAGAMSEYPLNKGAILPSTFSPALYPTPLPASVMPVPQAYKPPSTRPSIPPMPEPGPSSSGATRNAVPPLLPQADPKQAAPNKRQRGANSFFRAMGIFLLAFIVISTSLIGITLYQNHLRHNQFIASFIDSTHATATVDAQQDNPYPTYLPDKGSLALYDPLTDVWSSSWPGQPGCTFSKDGYHIQENQKSYIYSCSSARVFSDFSFEVQMKILKGDCGGLAIRSDENHRFYSFQVCANGHYTLNFFVDNNSAHERTLYSNVASALHSGTGQTNTLAIMARGHQISLYINQHPAGSVTSSAYSSGHIALLASEYSATTEVIFQEAKVWTY
ncbi:hypothetical protein EPA93_25750 [Ktedonosporobacter rubrisoli]|uniref:non-specific serine/threonine protein kinase n=1 Tax=Ktedonosporobacter rubrisoli TaxID=2509675 RepID=A0A4P6JU99_KTERU|nr:protein kinase [Ktedonosporobacter rubrisoli]QBD79199.1 hypothetical protein EPA93_25750 [Ktedonosporobacter rubrisoli]